MWGRAVSWQEPREGVLSGGSSDGASTWGRETAVCLEERLTFAVGEHAACLLGTRLRAVLFSFTLKKLFLLGLVL